MQAEMLIFAIILLGNDSDYSLFDLCAYQIVYLIPADNKHLPISDNFTRFGLIGG